MDEEEIKSNFPSIILKVENNLDYLRNMNEYIHEQLSFSKGKLSVIN